MFFFGKRRRDRQQWLAQEFPRHWREILSHRMWQYPHLPSTHRERIENVTTVMFHERQWTGGNGFVVTDEMKVTIAANAALFTLGLDQPYYFDRVPDIIVYPRTFYMTADQASHWSTDPMFGSVVESPRLGEAWHRGPVLLAWKSILHPEWSQHANLVLHEFAHHLDGLDGDMSGAPPMSDSAQLRDWFRVTEEHFLQLVGQAQRDEATLLDHYGASDRVEFFAVSVECFFERPHDLKERHPRLFEVLARYFRHDPTTWIPRERPWKQAQNVGRRPVRKKKRKPDKRAFPPRGHWDDPFSEGVHLTSEGWYEEANEAFTRAIEADPDDAEAYFERGANSLLLDEWEQSLADAEAGLRLDPEDPAGFVLRGSARVLLGEWNEGLADLKQGIDQHETPFGRWCMGLAYLELDDPRRALQQLDIAINLDPYEANFYLSRAEVYRALGNSEQAVRDEEKARHLAPE
jgi:Mlc titration factor MtfA (ptsG expression regulator)/regulator of sirC expression with transglutaminase-like and TPR domain